MGKLLLGLSMAVLLYSSSFAQVADTTAITTDMVFTVVDSMPEYPGGQAEMLRYLSTTKYPATAVDSAWSGTTYLSFVIEKNGEVSTLQVVRSSGYAILDNAALLHLAKMPNWKPGYLRGEPVRVSYVVPLRFAL